MTALTENGPIDRDSLSPMDSADPLAPFRERFLIPDDLIYMNGNSLGPLTIAAKERMHSVVINEWGRELIRGWNTAGWYDLPCRLGDKIGSIVGAAAGETVVCDSTSVNLFKAVAAARALRPDRGKVVTESGNFPTDLYVLDGLQSFSRENIELDVRQRDDVTAGIDSDTAVVVLTHVHYVSGAIFPMAEITKRAHDNGALIVWDLSHSAGAVPTNLNECDADFAVGCGYKHLNGGPGAPAFIFAARRHHETMRQPLSGWFGHAEPFKFYDEFVPANDIKRLLCGTTGVLGATALEAGVDQILEADPDEMSQKAIALSGLFQRLVTEHCGEFGLESRSPPDARNRGAHMSYAHADGFAVMQNLIARGVVGDFRAPDNMRFGFSPLFMRYTDVFDAVEILREILTSRSYTAPRYTETRSVT